METETMAKKKKPATPPDIDSLKAQRSDVASTDDIAEAGRKILLDDFIKMLSHADGTRTGENIEDVHQMRVAIRRMRSAFRLLDAYYKSRRTRPFTLFLKAIAAQLGAIRDLDVLIEDLEAKRGELDEIHREPLQAIIDTLDKKRRKARKKLVVRLDGVDYATFVNEYAAFLTRPGRGAITPESATTPHQVRHVLPREIHAHLADVRAYDDVIMAGAEPASLHALRIEFKRLRYIVDYFKDVLGNSGTEYVKAIKTMQDLLGRYNDIEVAHSYLEKIGGKKFDKAESAALEAYLAHIDAEAAQIETAVPDAWTKFNTRTIQRKLSDALLVLR